MSCTALRQIPTETWNSNDADPTAGRSARPFDLEIQKFDRSSGKQGLEPQAYRRADEPQKEQAYQAENDKDANDHGIHEFVSAFSIM